MARKKRIDDGWETGVDHCDCCRKDVYKGMDLEEELILPSWWDFDFRVISDTVYDPDGDLSLKGWEKKYPMKSGDFNADFRTGAKCCTNKVLEALRRFREHYKGNRHIHANRLDLRHEEKCFLCDVDVTTPYTTYYEVSLIIDRLPGENGRKHVMEVEMACVVCQECMRTFTVNVCDFLDDCGLFPLSIRVEKVYKEVADVEKFPLPWE